MFDSLVHVFHVHIYTDKIIDNSCLILFLMIHMYLNLKNCSTRMFYIMTSLFVNYLLISIYENIIEVLMRLPWRIKR